MLYEKETERDWGGVRFNPEGTNLVFTIIKKGGVYEIKNSIGDIIKNTYTQEKIEDCLNRGFWKELKEESKPITKELISNSGYSFTTPSLRDLLQQASLSEYVIRTGCQMFEGVDESERLKQVEQEWARLREVVNTLQTILNNKQ
jgi:hypothetical protein